MTKTFQETLYKIMNHSLDERGKNLDPADMAGLQDLIKDRQRLKEISNLRVSFS